MRELYIEYPSMNNHYIKVVMINFILIKPTKRRFVIDIKSFNCHRQDNGVTNTDDYESNKYWKIAKL